MMRNGKPGPRESGRPGIARVLRVGIKARVCLVAAGLAVVGGSHGALETISIEHAPLYLLFGTAPNFILTVDNSRSMNQAFLPDDIWGVGETNATLGRRDTANVANAQYYDPAVTYLPPLRADGTGFPHADFNDAPADAFISALACSSQCTSARLSKALGTTAECAAYCAATQCKLNLASEYAPVWDLTNVSGACTDIVSATDENHLYADYSVDPEHDKFANFRSTRSGLEDYQLARAWAWRCMRAKKDCPAFYYRIKPESTYQASSIDSTQSGSSSCATLDLSTIAPKDVPVACLKRVEVGTWTDRHVIYDKTQTDISDRVLEERRALLRNSDGSIPSNEELAKRNFANWFSYYRNRLLTVKSALSRAAASLPERVRVAYQDLTFQGQYMEGTDGYNALARTLAPFDASVRGDFYDWLSASHSTAGGQTFLVSAALRVHQFCSSDQAYLEEPQKTAGSGDANPVRACRNNFHLMFTDGFWEDLMPKVDPYGGFDPPADLGNNDNLPKKLPDAGQLSYAKTLGISLDYDPEAPYAHVFRDNNTGMLADVVFRSWISDLRTEGVESSRVPTLIKDPVGTPEAVFWNSRNDPADWQHVTTYTVGLGIAGNVTYDSGNWKYTDSDPFTGVEKTTTGNIWTNGFPGAWTAIGFDYDFFSGQIPTAVKVDDTWHAGINGRGGYLSAKDPTTLTARFTEIMDVVATVGRESAAAAAAVNTGATAGSDLVFQARMDTNDWSGDVRSFDVSAGAGKSPCAEKKIAGELCQDPGLGQYKRSAVDAMKGRTKGDRRIFTANGTTGISFGSANWSDLNATQKLGLQREMDSTMSAGQKVAEAKARLDYVAGDRTYEADGKDYRFRTRATLLGDFINAAPVVVGKPAFYYRAPGYGSAATGKTSFKTKYATRPEVVFAGANDGILHAFDASTLTELYGFVPPALFGVEGDKRNVKEQVRLDVLSNPAYGGNVVKHRPFVDGPIVAWDVSFGEGTAGDASDWHSVLVAGLGLGGQAVYALDVTEVPGSSASVSSFADEKFLWQIGDRNDSSVSGEVWDSDLGYVLGRPVITRIRGTGIGGKPVWVALFGNGYNSNDNDGSRAAGCDDTAKDADPATACGQAVLYVVEIATGKIIGKFKTGVGRTKDPRYPDEADADKRRPNALGQPTVVSATVDPNYGDPLGDFAYATDLFGNVWRFDLSNLTSAPVKLFSAADSSGNPQPITSAVAVGRHPTGVGTMVLFGTGQYLNTDDVTDRQVQSFYGIWDQGATTAGPHVARAALAVHKFLTTDIVEKGSNGAEVSRGRTSTDVTDLDDENRKKTAGWVIDFEIEKDGSLNKGERVVTQPQVQGERVIFVSLVPQTDPCAGGGYSWINALDLRDGSRLKTNPFDYNLDGSLSEADLLTADALAGSSIRLTPGGAGTGVYTAPSNLGIDVGRVSTLVSTSGGDVIQVIMSTLESWRVWQQLQ